MNRIIERLLLWLVFWSMLIEGLIGVFTIGYLVPVLTLPMAKRLARWRSYHVTYVDEYGEDE